MAKYCPNCGGATVPNSAFCNVCGASLTGGENANPYDAGAPINETAYYGGDAPVGPSFWGAFAHGVKHYADFSGRANRTEWWGYTVVYMLIMFLCAIVAAVVGAAAESEAALYGALFLFLAPLIIPTWAVQFRRMHDLGASGLWLLLSLVPVVGGLCSLVLFIVMGFVGGTPGENRFGPPSLKP